jgi:hypothetical protein
MTVNSDPASGPTKGLAISGPRDAGNGGGTARLTIRDRASFRVEQDLGLGTGVNPDTSDGTLEVRGPDAKVFVGGNLSMAVDLEGNVAGADADGNPKPGKATLLPVITGATQAVVNVTGKARIANGLLKVKLDGYKPKGGEMYTLIKGGTIEGPFKETDFTEATLAAGLSWEVEYAADAVRLKVAGQSQEARFDVSKIKMQNGKLHLEWTGVGTLVGADTVKGAYTAVSGVSGNTADLSLTGSQKFFQLKQ